MKLHIQHVWYTRITIFKAEIFLDKKYGIKVSGVHRMYVLHLTQ
jgi:hypothetical protein